MSNPATVFFIDHRSYDSSRKASVVNIQTQGTDMYDIIKHYLYVRDQGGKKYRAYAIDSGQTFQLGDKNGTSDKGVLNANIENLDWNIIPFDASGTNYFGVNPRFSHNGKYYTTMLAGFAYTPYSQGVKTYVVDQIWNGNAVIKEVSGIVPKSTPVLIECSSPNLSDNRLDFTTDNGSAVASNKLKGAFFNFYYKQHNNRVMYDANTMRILGMCSNGKLGFIKKDASEFENGAIEPNTAYLVVPAGSPDELPIMTYEEYLAAGIDGVEMDYASKGTISTLEGKTVRKNATTTEGLSSGIYIWNNKKVVVK